MSNLGDYVYFVLVYNYLQDQIAQFQTKTVANMTIWVSAIALTLVTLWIMIQGYRMVTGQTQRPMKGMVVDMARIVLIVTAATTMGVAGVDLQSYLSDNGALGSEISSLVGGGTSPVSQIDRNMAATQLTLAAIDVVQIAPGYTESAEQKAHAEMLA